MLAKAEEGIFANPFNSQAEKKTLKTSCQLQQHPNLSIKQLSALDTRTHTQSNTHKSISKRNFTHKPTSSNAQAPSKAFKHSGRSIGFQEASNTQVEPRRLWPSYSALSLATQEEPCWAAGQEPKTGK